MLNKTGSRNRWLFLLLISWITRSWGHEFWIEPANYRLDPAEPVRAHIKVGQHFKGDNYPYIPGNTRSFRITLDGVSRNVDSRVGDMPALDEQPPASGLVIVSHVTGTFFLTYDTRAKFEETLRYGGLDWVLGEHVRRNLPSSGFTEAYQRFAKSLVQSGDAGGRDELLGLDFEWLLEDNPYLSPGGRLQARLFWLGQPLVGAQARLFVRRSSKVIEQVLISDDQGRVVFSVEPGGEVLLNAVQMTLPSSELQQSKNAVWKSYWASLTFAVPDPQ